MATRAAPRVIDVLQPTSPLTGGQGTLAAALRGDLRVTIHGGPAGPVDLPLEWQNTIVRAVREVVAGHTVQVAVRDDGEIGTKEIASMLAVSRPTAVSLLDQGSIPFRKTPKGHRKARVSDVEAFIRGREDQHRSLATLQSRAEAHGHPMFVPHDTHRRAGAAERSR